MGNKEIGHQGKRPEQVGDSQWISTVAALALALMPLGYVLWKSAEGLYHYFALLFS